MILVEQSELLLSTLPQTVDNYSRVAGWKIKRKTMHGNNKCLFNGETQG